MPILLFVIVCFLASVVAKLLQNKSVAFYMCMAFIKWSLLKVETFNSTRRITWRTSGNIYKHSQIKTTWLSYHQKVYTVIRKTLILRIDRSRRDEKYKRYASWLWKDFIYLSKTQRTTDTLNGSYKLKGHIINLHAKAFELQKARIYYVYDHENSRCSD